ncbi:hypothetical protein E2C01_082875 [Portunus trituberculatus]|uniref:Secreted protein n=1 Tax=Portunus trituberculatus TaxID=210409 RepID=A0A5B7J301_PORTR|nr:hypothetical protein [Portunus trituberculatus]
MPTQILVFVLFFTAHCPSALLRRRAVSAITITIGRRHHTNRLQLPPLGPQLPISLPRQPLLGN